MAGREFSGLLGRQKREILRMITDQPPEPKRRKVGDSKAPPTTDVPGVLLKDRERFKKEDAKLPGTEARMRSLDSLKRDSEAPPSVHVSRVLQKHEDPILVNRNKRMFRQLLGTLEAGRDAEYRPVPKRRAVVKIEDWKIVDDNELKDDRNKDSAVDKSVMGVVASQNERTATWPRTNAEPPINYPFAKSSGADVHLTEQQNEQGFAQVGRQTKFVHIEKIGGKEINVLQGLELYTNVFSPNEQIKIVNCIYELQHMGQNGQLRGRTYSEPKKWMQGKGRITIQFGCCYNYATDRNGNPPGVLRTEEVEPLPPLFKEMIKKLVSWHIIPPTCIPDSCIVNIYEVGDCIPPHIDHHDFVRPFCTVSFLTKCNILFGSNLEIVGAGKFKGPASIPLPVGSVLIINGNGADIAKHCIPGVHDKRISITFRKIDKSKLPYNYLPDPELL